MRYEELKPAEFSEILSSAPIAYLPWGAHEWHGKHNPLGLDCLKSWHQAQAICEQTGGVVFPPVYCGHQTMKPHAGFRMTLEFRLETVQDLVRQYLEQMRDEGFKVIVLVLGHYGGDHVAGIRFTCEQFARRHPDVRVWAFPDYEPTRDAGIGGDHAGPNETSYMMYFRPDLVDLSRCPQGEQWNPKTEGANPDPRSATAERGRENLKVLVENVAPKVKELLAEVAT